MAYGGWRFNKDSIVDFRKGIRVAAFAACAVEDHFGAWMNYFKIIELHQIYIFFRLTSVFNFSSFVKKY